MKQPQFNIRTILAVLAIFTLSLIASSCGDKPEEVKTDDSGLRFISKDKIEVTHVKGTSPCPQQLDIIEVYENYQDENDDATTDYADEIDFVSENTAIMGVFASTNTSMSTFGSGEQIDQCGIFFTCNPPESVNTKVQFRLYKNGTVFRTEEVHVIVTVKE